MVVTKATCRAVYAMLRAMPPFRYWRMAPVHEVHFELLHPLSDHGRYTFDAERHLYEINKSLPSLHALIDVMAHEMAHHRQDRHGPSSKGCNKPGYGHGPDFKAIADRVCRDLGFNRRKF